MVDGVGVAVKNIWSGVGGFTEKMEGGGGGGSSAHFLIYFSKTFDIKI